MTAQWQSDCNDGLSSVGSYKNFDYTGSVQTFNACAGRTYKLEVWGAQGGDYTTQTNYDPGPGGYSYGIKNITSESTLYIYVGGQGGAKSSSQADQTSGGYNGGGTGYNDGGGGGATHMATITGVLSSLSSSTSSLLLAAGGGGGEGNSRDAGSGGGTTGGSQQSHSSDNNRGTGGTQTSAGTIYTACSGTSVSSYTGGFGYGGNTPSGQTGGGGGGGFYGGGSACSGEGGGGGSGYLNTSQLTSYGMKQYYAPDTTNTTSVSCADAKHDGNCANIGNGYARITRQS